MTVHYIQPHEINGVQPPQIDGILKKYSPCTHTHAHTPHHLPRWLLSFSRECSRLSLSFRTRTGIPIDTHSALAIVVLSVVCRRSPLARSWAHTKCSCFLVWFNFSSPNSVSSPSLWRPPLPLRIMFWLCNVFSRLSMKSVLFLLFCSPVLL